MNASATDSGAGGKPPGDSGGGRGGALRWRIAGSILLALAALGIAVWWLVAGRYRESTEDAYVDGNVVSVTAQVSGVITAINADNTDYVTAGNPLVKLDDTDAKLALARAEAQLAKTVRQVRTQYAAVEQGRANQQLREIELARVKADLAHRKELVGSGAISGEEARHAEDAVRASVAALNAANHQLAASTAQVDHTTLATHPDVLAASSQVRDAYVAAYRTEVPAPVTGVVTKRSAQVGQKISPGISLMSVVPLDHLWVNANFKESQLRHIRIGQPVRLYADVYGDDVVYQGTVIGQDAGTGSAFSLLPAQNATGNWIKIVQRVPVRIALDPQQVAKHPLQLGLSMKVVVETQQRNGTRLVAPGSRAHGYQTDVFAGELARADDVVQKIIQANQ
ncbi:efflux RND transporter periplasmic adaptor subunit [Paraburkholderia lacunae]|uniref:EmrA/EmrK family multidrug efflux transporter periplasmic adaptor subunit n=1 Tax=Paraburkholderia lacunae TaxID=2211104 RepID=A0A370MWU6_9BURK|nr:efflux RND transporter periplasmic adaptor subunit [Paraburkholderia lacunae]RDJ97804.1 EmrA/EmrK family multidrug efflux transporter periplasmic adaptor subunit [Paraburkholderia lacunae]